MAMTWGSPDGNSVPACLTLTLGPPSLGRCTVVKGPRQWGLLWPVGFPLPRERTWNLPPGLWGDGPWHVEGHA